MGNNTTVASLGVWGVFTLIALNALEFYQPEFFTAVISGYEELLAIAITTLLAYFLPNIGRIGQAVSGTGGNQSGYLESLIMYFLSAVSILLLLAACITPRDSLCSEFEGKANTYCLARVELNTAIATANQAFTDGVLTADEHLEFLEKANQADAALDTAKFAIDQDDDPTVALRAAKAIMLELL